MSGLGFGLAFETKTGVFNISFAEGKRDKRIGHVGLFLRNQVDILMGMGTSALEGARVGVPTIGGTNSPRASGIIWTGHERVVRTFPM